MEIAKKALDTEWEHRVQCNINVKHTSRKHYIWHVEKMQKERRACMHKILKKYARCAMGMHDYVIGAMGVARLWIFMEGMMRDCRGSS
jgi:hypothetical protein